MIKSYIAFYFQSGNEHGLHAPFIFDIYTSAIRPNKFFYPFLKIENLRAQLLANPTNISVTDLGTGSARASNIRSISTIARSALKKKDIAQIIFRLVNYLQPTHIIDLGTSLGITTAYMACAKPSSQITSFEGCPNIAAEAMKNFKKLGVKNVEVVVGNIDITLPAFIKNTPQLDFVFVDANHTYEATLRYFEICLIKATTETVFVFDDIHWSSEMVMAWEAIKAHQKVTLSIDLFHVGIIFLRTNQPKQHFVLRI